MAVTLVFVSFANTVHITFAEEGNTANLQLLVNHKGHYVMSERRAN